MNMNKIKKEEKPQQAAKAPGLPEVVKTMPGYFGQVNLGNMKWHLKHVSGLPEGTQKKIIDSIEK